MKINTNDNWLKRIIQHYNPKKYWKYRNIVVNPDNKTPKIIKLYMLYKIKKMDAYNNSSFGTNLNSGAHFEGVPHLPHGLNGIIISHYCKFGEKCTIFHQVTVADDPHIPKSSADIGNNVVIGAGAKIIGKVKIGNNVKIGANAVVVDDIPDNCTVVGIPAKIVNKKGKR